ncbi:hypothetical protein, partial [Maribacter flavus]
ILQKTNQLNRVIVPDKYEVFTLDLQSLTQATEVAPKRISKSSGLSNIVISFPSSNGKTEPYRIQKTDVMHPDLA